MSSSDEALSRRAFFRFGLGKTREVIGDVVTKKVDKHFPRPGLRPPGALPEGEFLLTCTRCTDCLEACPHEAILQIDPASSGVYGNTPFIDPKHKPCSYCEDFPCISACKAKALVLPDEGQQPDMGTVKFNPEHCLVNQGQYCDYCFNTCPSGIDAISKDNNMPVFDEDRCIGCGKCVYICVAQTGPALVLQFEKTGLQV